MCEFSWKMPFEGIKSGYLDEGGPFSSGSSESLLVIRAKKLKYRTAPVGSPSSPTALKVLLREEGKRHDLVDAVFALGDDDLVRIVRRVEALSGFLQTEDGASLLAGYRRAANILKAEAKKAPGEDYALNEDLDLLTAPQEQALSASLRTVQDEVGPGLAGRRFRGRHARPVAFAGAGGRLL